MTPTDAKPDLSKLRLINESELRRGGIIGSGAFGTVYKVGQSLIVVIIVILLGRHDCLTFLLKSIFMQLKISYKKGQMTS